MDRILENGWFKLSLTQQMVNIGLEVKRAFRFALDIPKRDSFLDKALEYTSLSIKDPKNATVIPELKLSLEVLQDYKTEHKLDSTKEQIMSYYAYFNGLLQNSKPLNRAAQPRCS